MPLSKQRGKLFARQPRKRAQLITFHEQFSLQFSIKIVFFQKYSKNFFIDRRGLVQLWQRGDDVIFCFVVYEKVVEVGSLRDRPKCSRAAESTKFISQILSVPPKPHQKVASRVIWPSFYCCHQQSCCVPSNKYYETLHTLLAFKSWLCLFSIEFYAFMTFGDI